MNTIEDRAVTEAEAAEFLGISQMTLRTARSLGDRPGRMRGPSYFKLGARCVRYSMKDLHEFREAHRVPSDGGSAA